MGYLEQEIIKQIYEENGKLRAHCLEELITGQPEWLKRLLNMHVYHERWHDVLGLCRRHKLPVPSECPLGPD